MPATNNFTFVKGEDVEIDWEVVASAAADAPMIDLTGKTLEFKVKRKDNDETASLVSSSTTLVTPVVEFNAKTTIAAAQMSLLTRGDYRCALWVTSTPVACLSRGNFSVLDSVQD